MGERRLQQLMADGPVINQCLLRHTECVWQGLRARPTHGMMLSGNMR